MPRYLISFDDGSMDHIPKEDMPMVGDAAHAVVREIKQAMPHLPVILGGYTTHENVTRRLAEADGVFVGACLKANRWDGRVDIERVRAYVDLVSNLP